MSRSIISLPMPLPPQPLDGVVRTRAAVSACSNIARSRMVVMNPTEPQVFTPPATVRRRRETNSRSTWEALSDTEERTDYDSMDE